jgi:MYXO-CTERM domain-containing protein
MHRSFWRIATTACLFLVIAACAGGGAAGGCGGCGGGASSLPGGFPRASTIPNSAGVRVTRPALDFLSANIPTLATNLLGGTSAGGVIQFEIPKSESSAGIGTLRVCPQGPDKNANPPRCVADINIGNANLKIDAITPSSVRIHGTIPVRVQNLPLNVPILGDVNVGLGSGTCAGGTPNFDYQDIPLEVILPLVQETIPPRDGYTKVDVKNAVIDPKITRDDVRLCKDCGGLSGVCNTVIGLIKDLVFGLLVDGIKGQLTAPLEDALCEKPDRTKSPVCPTGGKPDNGDPARWSKCVFVQKPDTCMPTKLGAEGNLPLGSLLAGISPGTQGSLDFVFASRGDMNPAPGRPADNTPYPGHTPNGITLSMTGGALPRPIADCIVPVDNPLPEGIPLPDELLVDRPADWPQGTPAPHIGIALSGRFLNYALGNMYNSGALCLGITTDKIQLINTGLLSALIPSLKTLTIEQKAGAVALVTRPSKPPVITLGGGTDIKTDPLLRVVLEQIALDFYVFSYDRYVRAFTFTGDLSLPVNLQTGKDEKRNPNGGLLPVIGDISIKNESVSNADLLTDDPATIAAGLASVVGGLSGQLVGSLSAIDLSTALQSVGLSLTIPDGGIRKITKGEDEFLGIFATLGTAPPATPLYLEPQVEIAEKTVFADAMTLVTARKEKLPELRVRFGAAGDAADIEYSWALDEGARSAWSREREVVIKDDVLFLQGRHELKLYARVVGHPETERAWPAKASFVIDALAPFVRVKSAKARGRVGIEAWDVVSDASALVARYRLRAPGEVEAAGAFGDWQPLDALANIEVADATAIEVEVRDEEGNIARVTQPLVRGRPDGTLSDGGDGGCGCSTPGQTHKDPLAAGLVALGLVLFLALRRRARADGGGPAGLAGKAARRPRTAPAVALGMVAALASLNEGCSCGNDEPAKTGCGEDCNQECNPGLEPGIVGAYTSVARTKDGKIWVAGYNDAAVTFGESFIYGDLVVGQFDPAKGTIGWQTVDGIPERTDGTCSDFDPSGWRRGEVESGDNVGLWTSLVIGKDDQPLVAYYDATNRALKFASYDGRNWSVHAIASRAREDIGRYAKMVLEGDRPLLAYLSLRRAENGKLRSAVTLARAKTSKPKEPGDWTFEEAAFDEEAPCRASFCNAGEACVESTGACSARRTDCQPACGSNQVCVTVDGRGQCAAEVAATRIDDYPNAYGTYISLAVGPSGPGMVVYDRVRGNLVGLANVNGAWEAKILDGETGSRENNSAVDLGDVGVGASLAIDGAGRWHVSYVNGITEALQYITVGDGAIGRPEVVDDGRGVDGALFSDGKHLVGDDSHIVEEDGSLVIYYQDATAGTLRVARGNPKGDGTHDWDVRVIPQAGKFGGFFPRRVPGSALVSNFFRTSDRGTKTVSGDVAFVTP